MPAELAAHPHCLVLQEATFLKKVHVAGCHLDLGTTTWKNTMIRLYVADLQCKPWPFCLINQFCSHISKPGNPLQFWSPDLTLCLTKASIKIMTSLKIIIHVIIIINCTSMKLQMKFSKTSSPFKLSDVKQGREGHLFQRGCFLEGGR